MQRSNPLTTIYTYLHIFTFATSFHIPKIFNLQSGTVCSAPTRGFNVLPTSPVSIIDFHGFLDNVVPYSPEAPDNLGEGKTASKTVPLS